MMAKRTRTRLGLILGAVLMGLPFLFSCEETTGPGGGTTPVSTKLLIYSDTDVIQANGGTTQILVKVYTGDDTTKVASGVKVTFTASQAGTRLYIQAKNDISDANGYARATLYSGSRAGVAGVTASIANFSNSLFVTVTAGTGLVSASPTSILADGISTSTISATVIDSLGQPQPGALVRFAASQGVITPQAYSNEEGRAVAILRSAPSKTDISATITATTSAAKVSSVAVSTDSTTAAKTARTQGTLGTTTVVFRGVTIAATPKQETIFANNADSTVVTITVKETSSGAPVSGVVLTFSTSLGQLRKTEVTTGADGSATVVLFGGSVSGTATFTAKYGEGLSFTKDISLVKQVFMTLESSPSVLSANGTDIAKIRAYLYDADNNPVEGVTIYFSTNLGWILPSAQTNQWGEALVDLRSPRVNGIATVTVRWTCIREVSPGLGGILRSSPSTKYSMRTIPPVTVISAIPSAKRVSVMCCPLRVANAAAISAFQTVKGPEQH